MVFAALLNIILIGVLVTILFGLGFMGGIPAWYKNIRENRANCDDVQYANDSSKWNPDKQEPKNDLDKYQWTIARTFQGKDPRFETNLEIKAEECDTLN